MGLSLRGKGSTLVAWVIHNQSSPVPYRANFFFGRGFNLEIFLNLQGSEFIQTLLLIYNHLAKFVVYKSWTRSALLKRHQQVLSGKLHNL